MARRVCEEAQITVGVTAVAVKRDAITLVLIDAQLIIIGQAAFCDQTSRGSLHSSNRRGRNEIILAVAPVV